MDKNTGILKASNPSQMQTIQLDNGKQITMSN